MKKLYTTIILFASLVVSGQSLDQDSVSLLDTAQQLPAVAKRRVQGKSTEGQNTLYKLQNGESIVVDYASSGCFSQRHLKIEIKNLKGQLIAKIYRVPSSVRREESSFAMINTDDSLLQTSIISKKGIAAFTKFEKELAISRGNGCTTVDDYHVRSKYLNIDRMDGSCQWHGWSMIQSAFFPGANF